MTFLAHSIILYNQFYSQSFLYPVYKLTRQHHDGRVSTYSLYVWRSKIQLPPEFEYILCVAKYFLLLSPLFSLSVTTHPGRLSKGDSPVELPGSERDVDGPTGPKDSSSLLP